MIVDSPLEHTNLCQTTGMDVDIIWVETLTINTNQAILGPIDGNMLQTKQFIFTSQVKCCIADEDNPTC